MAAMGMPPSFPMMGGFPMGSPHMRPILPVPDMTRAGAGGAPSGFPPAHDFRQKSNMRLNLC